MGPSLVKQGLKNGTIFARGIPAEVKAFEEKCPEVLELVVPVDKTAETRKALGIPGSAEAQRYSAVEAAFAKGGK